MTIAGKSESTIAIPDGVSVVKNADIVEVSGPKGKLSRNFASPGIVVNILDGLVSVSCEYPRIKGKALVCSFAAPVRNMIRGLSYGYTYHLNFVFNHFPMKVAVKDNRVEINNYMGGRATRYANIVGGCKVKISGNDVTVEGIDIEACGQTSANLERATSRVGFDKRVFQDGIYIVAKSHKVKE